MSTIFVNLKIIARQNIAAGEYITNGKITSANVAN
jgi:hypothetical protein